jgi:hypothetical protein
MTVSLLGYLACLVTLGVAAARLLDRGGYTERAARAARHYLSIGQACSALAVGLWTPDSRRIVLRHHWPPAVPFLLGDVLAMTAGFCLLATLAYAADDADDHAGRRTVGHAAVLACCCVATVTLANTRVLPLTGLAQLIPPAYIAGSYGSFTRGLLGRGRRPDTPAHVRLSMAITTVSASTRVLWALWQAGAVVLAATRGDTITAEPQSSELLAATAVTIGAVGTTLATWSPRAIAALERRRLQRAYRAITPLWEELTAAVPEVLLRTSVMGGGNADPPPGDGANSTSSRQPPRRPGQDDTPSAMAVAVTPAQDGLASTVLAVLTAQDALHRRVMETTDARRALRPWLDPAVTDHFHWMAEIFHLRAREASMLIEAAALASALARKATGDDPGLPPPPPRLLHATDLAHARWLAGVGQALLHNSQIRVMLPPRADRRA